MNTWKVILATMLIFGTGVVTGGLLVQHSMRFREHRSPARALGAQRAGQTNSPAAFSRFELLRRVQRELDLNPEQREPIEHIIKEGQERMKKLNETFEPRRRQELRRTIEEFRKVLTPEQRVRFDVLVKQRPQRGHDQHKGGPAREVPTNTVAPALTTTATNS